ncbi:MAG: amino acid adenylation domain-containing protein [Verrucomicrobia bacterium]|nr:amino acid adenylation domain-containing protein [Verrucomicrobiota bacterium]
MASVPSVDGLLTLFDQQVSARGAASAVVAGSASLSYEKLREQSLQWAGELVRSGVRPGSMVGLHLDRSLEFVVAVLAVLRAGCTYVPLGTDWPQSRIALLAEDAQLAGILSATPTSSALATVSCPVWEAADFARRAVEGGSIAEEIDTVQQPAYVMFTSGSTGRPKGVVVPQRAILRLCSGDYLPWGPDRRFLLLAPLSFDASTLELWGALLHGGTCVVHPELKMTFGGLRRVLRDERINCLWLTAGLFNHLVDEEPEILAPVEYVLTGGEALSVPHVRRALAALPGTHLLNGYGPTEATTFTCTYRIPQDEPLGTSIPIGRPLPRTVCRVLDAQRRPVPVGTSGELFIGGEALALGYLNQPELTAEKFVPDPESNDPAARLYRSGDLVRELPDGNFEYLGRLDDQLKIRGFRIEPGELEAVLVTLPGIRQAAVAARVGSDGSRALAAYLVVDEGARLSRASLREQLATRVPAFLQPDFVGVLTALPLNANGKVDRSRLAAEPCLELPASSVPVTAARTELEAELVALWEDLLGRKPVGIHDRFADLGGHSLRALRLVARIREHWGVPLTLPDFLSQPTVAELVQWINQAPRDSAVSAIPVASREVPIPLTGEQAGLWFVDQQCPDPSAYHVAFAWRLRGPLDRHRLEESWRRVVERHEILRTWVELRDGEPFQASGPLGPWSLPWQELGPAETREALAERLTAAARVRFELARVPLWRVEGFGLGEADHLLLVTVHHLLIDEWSLRLIFSDWAAAYSAGEAGPNWLPLTRQFADYAAWHRARMEQPEADRHREFWRSNLAGAPSRWAVPGDRNVTVPTGAGARMTVTIPPEVRRACEQLGRQAKTTPYVAALSAYFGLLSRWSGEGEGVIGTPLSQRSEPGLEGLAGLLIHTLPLRLKSQPGQSVLGMVETVRNRVHEAFAHGELPLTQIVKAVGPARRESSRVPLYNAMFVLLDEPWPDLQLPGLVSQPWPVETRTHKVDLILFLTDNGAGGWQAELEYNSDLFSESAARRLADQVGPFFAEFSQGSSRLWSDLAPVSAVSGDAPSSEPNARGASSGSATVEADSEVLTASERRLAAIWSRLLNVPDVRRRDDFFALGGHSLLALRLISAVEKEFQQSLTLTHLVTHPTLTLQAEWLTSAGAGAVTGASAKLGFRGEGAGAPLFLIPGLYGFEFLATELADVVKQHRRYFDGLQHRGLSPGSTPFTRVEDLAQDLVRQINEVYPHGPVALMGSSYGGLVAYEVGCQLASAGRSVEFILLLDTILGVGRRRSLAEMAWVIGKRFCRRPSGKRLEYLRMLVSNKFAPGLWYDPEEEGRLPETPEQAAVIQANYQAGDSYRPRGFDGRVILFQASRVYDHVFLRYAPEPGNGWGGLPIGKFQIESFDCLHHELFQNPIFPPARRYLDQLLNTLSPKNPS